MKCEERPLAPTTTGRTDKRTLLVLEGGSEVVEELAFVARHCSNLKFIFSYLSQILLGIVAEG